MSTPSNTDPTQNHPASDPTAGDEHTIAPGVTDAEVMAAMGVNSVPDEVRTHAEDPDETRQTMDATGQLRAPADEG